MLYICRVNLKYIKMKQSELEEYVIKMNAYNEVVKAIRL